MAGRGDIGICAMDVRSFVCQVYQFADTQTYVKTLQLIQVFQPIEVRRGLNLLTKPQPETVAGL